MRRIDMSRKRIIIGIAVLFAAAMIWRITALIVSGSGGKSDRPQRPPVAVEVDSVRYGPITEVRQLTGTVYPLYQYVVAPKVSGRIIAIRKRIGDWVKSGEVIARIDNAEYQQGVIEAEAALKIAEASLAEARSQLELARQEKERADALQAKGIASPAELDAAVSNFAAQQSRYELAQAQVEQRTASLKAAKIRLGYTVLTASHPGLIGERFVDEGALLAPNDAVVSVIGIDSVIVRTTIVERDYGRIKTGQPATVGIDAVPGRSFPGLVSRIAPMLQEASRVAQMEVEVKNDEAMLKPGMFARVDVVVAQAESTQIVPTEAVVNRNGGTGVFTVDAGERTARYSPVTTGISTPTVTEILSPALHGLVITLGQHLLEDGSPVLLPTAPQDTSDGPKAGSKQDPTAGPKAAEGKHTTP
jgi:RND family efflux transporter MFP subunit